MKKFIYQKQSHFTADGDHFKANNRTLADFPKPCGLFPKNNRLQAGDFGHIFTSTTTLHANRKRYLSGIFLSKFHLSEYQSLKGVIHSLTEFAIRAICRNKAETIRTNKASRCNAVVEPLSHPLGAVHSFNLTETLQIMIYKFLTHGDTAKEPLYAVIPNTEQNHSLLLADLGGMLFTQSEKEIVEPRNSFNLVKANSTPNRAFFVRNFRTPKENHFPTFGEIVFLSMVERNGKGSPFAVCLTRRFSSLLRSTAQTLESLSGRLSKNLLVKAFTMIYKFLSIQGNKRLKITVYANSKAEALSRIQWLNKPLCIVSNLKAQGGVYA